jgi:hypothetical protein
MQQMEAWRGKIIAALDIHCPWIRSGINEELATVGIPQPWQEELDCFTALLEQWQSGTLKFRAANCTPYGHEWNSGKGHSFNRYMQEKFSQSQSWAFEIPYAQAGGQMMTVKAAREFGYDIARALSLYIQQRKL